MHLVALAMWRVPSRNLCLLLLAVLRCCLCVAIDTRGQQLSDHILKTTPVGDTDLILKAFDAFSHKHRLGMHLGKEKGTLIELAVREGLPASGPSIVLETGCHAGDGTLRAITGMLSRNGSTIVSTEDNERWLIAATHIVSHATKHSDVTFLPKRLAEDADFNSFLEELRTEHGISRFDTVVLDQDQQRFLYQLQAMMAGGFLKPGATVYVDNAKTKASRLRKYLEFVDSASGNGFRTRLVDITEPYADAVAISTFVGTPDLQQREEV